MPESKNTLSITEVENTIDRHANTVAMQCQLRHAIFNAINEDDVSEIVKKQVEKAKQGDNKSLQFVMKYVLGFGPQMTVQQINVMDVETAARLANKNK